MLWKAALIGVFAFVVALVVFAMGRPSWHPPAVPPYGQQSQQQSNEPGAEHRVAESGWHAWLASVWREPINLFTLVLALATIFLGVMAVSADRVANMTAKAAQQSADTTRDAVVAAKNATARELRAYVYLETGARKWPRTSPETSDRWSIFLTVKNSGKTWANNLRMQFDTIRNPVSDAFDSFHWAVAQQPPMVLGPGQELSLQFRDVELSEVAKLVSGELRIFYVAWITYEDAMSDPPVTRQTQLYRRLNGDVENNVAFGWMSAHNCADGDCP